MIYVQDYLDVNADSSANQRRRNDLSYCGGFSSVELKDYVEDRYLAETGEILKLSHKTIQRLFIPPNRNVKAASYYKSLFNVKVMGGIYF